MKYGKQYRAAAICGFVLTVLGIIVWFVYVQIEIQRGIAQWERLGGGVNVHTNARFGPDEMLLGSMPGISNSDNWTSICDAAILLNGVGGCRKLALINLGWSCEAYRRLLRELQLEQLSLSDERIDTCLVEYLANRKDIKCLRIGEGLSADHVRYLLRQSPSLRMDLSRGKLAIEDCHALQGEFGSRLQIFGL